MYDHVPYFDFANIRSNHLAPIKVDNVICTEMQSKTKLIRRKVMYGSVSTY